MKKLSDDAKEHGIGYRTAYNHFVKGLISGAYQLPTGTIVIPDHQKQEVKTFEYVVCYARVSSSENKKELELQAERIVSYSNAKGWQVSELIKEVGSGVNDARPKLLKALQEGKATKLVVEHKDRLTRFGFNFINELCKKFNCEVVIINNVNDKKEDIIQDFVSIITSFCSKIYGQRRSKRKTETLIKELSKKD